MRRIGWALLGGLAACGSDEHSGPQEVPYACDQGVAISVIFNPISRIATVRDLGPQDILLPQRAAASGFRYATERVSLVGQGSEAVLTVDGASVRCRALGGPGVDG